MQLKRENTQDEARPRYHLLHRLSKAAKWSTTLKDLCAERGDERTALEAEAYCAFMWGNNHLEREQWAHALTHLKRTRTICTELSRVSTPEQAHLYKQMAEQVQPSIRFCSYNLGDEDGEGEEGEQNMEELAEAEGASEILRSKLAAVMNESRAKRAQNFTEIEVRIWL